MLRGLLALLIALASTVAWGQRVQFPTMVDTGAPGSVYAPPPSFAPGGTSPPVIGTLQQAPPTTWDPYAAGGAVQPYNPLAPSPYSPPPTQPLYAEGVASPFPQGGVFSSLAEPMRLVQEVRLRYTWLAGDVGSNPNDFDVNVVEGSVTFAFPFLYNQAPLLVTPGFAVNYLEGPVTAPPNFADLPPRVYDAFLDFAWQPQVTSWLGANLGARVGVYSDFETFTTRSLRIMGRALGVMTFSPTMQVAAGVVYIDRLDIKLLPAGGVIWTPNPDARYEILFPNPKLARRWTTLGTTDVWYYLSGEYGGGSWTIERDSGASDAFDYNDIRVIFGVEGVGLAGTRGFFEVGYVFNREILYHSDMSNPLKPNDTVMLRTGLSF